MKKTHWIEGKNSHTCEHCHMTFEGDWYGDRYCRNCGKSMSEPGSRGCPVCGLTPMPSVKPPRQA